MQVVTLTGYAMALGSRKSTPKAGTPRDGSVTIKANLPEFPENF